MREHHYESHKNRHRSGSNSWAYTKIGHVDEEYLENLEEVLSGPETEITFSLK